MKRLFTILICALVCVLSAHAWKSVNLTIKVNGAKRNMVVYTPNTVSKNLPLMIVTHGMNQDPGYQANADHMYELIDKEQFIIAYLEGEGKTWDTGGTKDRDFVSQTIDEMYTKYGINKNRVYWSGFSMGSALIYSCMADMVDKIAAFAPTSGVAFSGKVFMNCKKPVNVIHCHAYGDDVFKYNDWDIHGYVKSLAEDLDKCTTYKKTANYRTPGGNTGDKEVWTNGENGTIVELFSYNANWHNPSSGNSQEIWDFCKQFSLLTLDEEFQQAYNQLETLVYEWKDTPEATSLSTYATMQKYLNTYAPEKMETDAQKTSATTRLTKLISIFENAVANKTKVEVVNSGETIQPEGFDPNFHIYLCFGQSNMEGNATAEAKDKAYVDPRFMMMACVNQTNANRTKGQWYTAYPPLCREMYFGVNLTPADYFGREMVANLPESIKVGVLNVAVGGCAIELFDEDKCADQIRNADQWFKDYCAAYNNNPYKVLVTMAKKAQEKGVIKGILLHQGCSNNGQADWPVKVKRVYIRLLNDLGLNEEEVPLLIGETLSQAKGGICWGHNNVIAKTASVIPNSYVISSEGCPGASDGLHFTAEGYRMLGKRYAQQMLQILDQKKEIDFDTSETFFPLTPEAFNPSLYLQGEFASTHTATRSINSFKTTQTYNGTRGFGGWRYSKGVDLSAHKYLVVVLSRKPSCNPVIKIFDTDDYLNPCYAYTVPKTVVANEKIKIPLKEMQTEDGKTIDPSHIYMVGFEIDQTTTPLYIDQLYLSDDEELNPTGIESLVPEVVGAKEIYLDLQGRPVENPTNGIYIRRSDGKKIMTK